MQRIIKNNAVVDETWHLLPKDASFDGISNCDDLIVPLALWREHGHALKARDGGLGVWLDADEEAEQAEGDRHQHHEADHQQRVRDLNVDKQMRGRENDRAYDHRFGRRRADIGDQQFKRRHR